jgi:hypothetical protein
MPHFNARESAIIPLAYVGMGGWTMLLFMAGFATAVAPSMLALAWMLWMGGIGEDPDQPGALVLPFVKRQPKRRGSVTEVA